MYHLILAFFNEWSDVEEVQDNAEVKFEIFYSFLGTSIREETAGCKHLFGFTHDVHRLVGWWKLVEVSDVHCNGAVWCTVVL